MTAAEPEGVLAVDKPAGPTSHDVVAIARRALRTRRIGHTGTLDPFASGLLLLCVGSATRIAEYVTAMDKRYTATVRLGVATDTDDHTGAVIAEADVGSVTRDAVEAALAAQRGAVMQLPPSYSAKKRDGERAYAAARQGRPLVLDAVPVRISELTITRFELPDVELDVLCSSGTYIRAIARDLGATLGVGAHLTALRRTEIGGHSVADAIPLDAIGDDAAVRGAMIAPLDALGSMPSVELSDDDVAHIRHGRAVRAPAAAGADPVAAGTVALAAAGRLIGIGVADGDGMVRPKKVMVGERGSG